MFPLTAEGSNGGSYTQWNSQPLKQWSPVICIHLGAPVMMLSEMSQAHQEEHRLTSLIWEV
jgi:hypothetical protein